MNNGRERLGPAGPSDPAEPSEQPERPGHFERLEAQLARVRPAPLPAGLFDRVADRVAGRLAEAETPRHSGDRPLWCAIGAGLAAACTIVALLTSDSVGPPAAGGATPAVSRVAVGRPPRFGDYPQLLARADEGGWDVK